MSESPRKRLPVNPSLEHLKKQAKRRVKAELSLQLAEAQQQIAREYGCKSWAELAHVVEVMSRGADQLVNVKHDYEPLPAAVRKRDVATVRAILDSGNYTPHDLDAGLAHAAWYGGGAPEVLRVRKEIFDLLLEHGADPDGQYGSNYGPIVFGCGECVEPDGLRWLLDAGCDVTFAPVDTKYGGQCALSYWLGSYARGSNERKHRGIELLLNAHAFIPPEVSPPILAIHRGRAAELAELVDRDPSLVRRRFADMPYGNMSLAGATLLHCAVEFGELECIDVLLNRWTDANPRADVINGLGGQTPIFHAIANNNLPALEHLVKRLSYAIECHRIRATFKVADIVYDTPMNPIEYAEKMSRDDAPAWRRASARELELVRSVVWPGIKRKTDEEKTPRERLEESCRQGDFDAVRRMVDAGEISASELHFGVANAVPRHLDIARYLVERGADVNADIVENYGPALLGFCEGLDDEGVKAMLDLGAGAAPDPNRVTKYPAQNTPLRMACDTYVRGRNPAKHRIIDLLIERGAKADDETILAIHRGDAKALDRMLSADPSLVGKKFPGLHNTPSFAPLAGGTLLHVAVEYNERECCEVLFKHFADINARADVIDGVGGHTPLSQVAKSWLGAGFPTLEYLVKRVGNWIDTSIKAKVRDGEKIIEQTVLEFAGERERKLLEPLDRRTQIKQAILRGDTDVVNRLLDAHPDLLAPDLWPVAIFQAKSFEMTKLLLDRGLNPDECSAPRKPLHLASDRGLIDIVRLLLSRGARLDVVDGENITPYELMNTGLASPSNAEEIRQALRDAGARDTIFSLLNRGEEDAALEMLRQDPSLRDAVGPIFFKPLDTAARAGAVRMVHTLLELGAAADGVNPADNTPLWLACQSDADAAKRIDVARLLIDAGADVNRRCEEGTTALHFAAWRGPAAMLTLLLDRGARPWIADDKGQEPVKFARESDVNPDKDEVVKLLTEIRFDDDAFREAVAAMDAGDVDRLRQLLREHPHLVTARVKDGDSITRGYFTRPTLLHFVANNPNRYKLMAPRILESTQAILDAGAAVDAVTEHENGGTTLALVASSEPAKQAGVKHALIELLVKNGADPTAGLDAAIQERYPETAEVLLKLGAKHTLMSAAALGDVDALRTLLKDHPPEREALRAAQSAAMYGKRATLDVLLDDAGVDVNARLPHPFSPTLLHQAAYFSHRDLVDHLLARGADPTLKDTQFNGTPAGWAEHAGHKELATRLRDSISSSKS